MPRHDDGSISGIDPFYTREAEDNRDWEDIRQARIEQEDMEEQDRREAIVDFLHDISEFKRTHECAGCGAKEPSTADYIKGAIILLFILANVGGLVVLAVLAIMEHLNV